LLPWLNPGYASDGRRRTSVIAASVLKVADVKALGLAAAARTCVSVIPADHKIDVLNTSSSHNKSSCVADWISSRDVDAAIERRGASLMVVQTSRSTKQL